MGERGGGGISCIKPKSLKEAAYHTQEKGGRTAMSIDWNLKIE